MTRFRDAKNRIDDILKQFEGTDFYEWVDVNPVPFDAPEYIHESFGINSLYDFMIYGEYPKNIRWSAGATRIVIWDENHEDYVMKIAIYDSDEHYNETEEQVYNDAEMRDVEDAFAWCSCIYMPHERKGIGRGIYAMEYACCDEEVICDYSYSYGLAEWCDIRGLDPEDDEAKDEYYDYYCSYCDENAELMEYAKDNWGWRLASAVEQFIWDFHINDLHSANMGYIGNRLVITDYASY